MSQWLRRKLRVWARWVRFSPLVLGDKRWEVVEERLTRCYGVVNRFLSDLGIEYCIIYGTLLGWYREGGIIPGDEDVDFATLERHYQTILDAAGTLPPGYRLHDTGASHAGPKLYVSDPNGWEADIYFFQEIGMELKSTAIESCTRHMEPFDRELLLPLREATFLDQPTWVPGQPRKWLEHSYGYLGKDAFYDSASGLWRKKGS